MKTKINLSMIILTSIICILPLFYGLLIYNGLPDRVGIPISGFDSEGNYNWYFHKSYFVFGMPFLLMALNIIIKTILYRNPKWNNETKALKIITDWSVPAISLFFVPLWLFRAMGAVIPIEMMLYIFSGLIIIVFGNYIPKSKMDKSSMFGIKLSWGPNISDENWIKGRRLVGYFWITAGVIYIIITFLFKVEFLISVIRTLILLFILYTVPILYAWLVYMSEKNNNK